MEIEPIVRFKMVLLGVFLWFSLWVVSGWRQEFRLFLLAFTLLVGQAVFLLPRHIANVKRAAYSDARCQRARTLGNPPGAYNNDPESSIHMLLAPISPASLHKIVSLQAQFITCTQALYT